MTRRSFHRRRGVLATSLTRLLMSRAPRTVSRAFSGRSALLTIGKQLRINMNSYSSGRRPRRSRGGGRRRGNYERARGPQEPAKTQKKTFWQRVSELFELFNGVGHVQNAEVVSYRHNQRSKGFAFVQMQTVEEAKRAVEELHDKEFLGRRLVVSGAKSDQHQPR